MFRPILLCGLAAACLSAPAMADTLMPKTGSLYGSGFGLTSTNVGTATNTAAGIGNVARQRAGTVQAGSGGGMPGPMAGAMAGPLVSTNVGVSTNTAAGIGNSAQQRVLGSPGNGVQVGLNMTGRGPLVSTNVDYTTNLAAGLGNSAGQKFIGSRR